MSVVESTMLVLVSAGANSNKFYEAKLHDDGTVERRWGRVGATGQSKVDAGGRTGYLRIISEKMDKGYQVFDTTDPATSVPRGASLAAVARTGISGGDPDPTLSEAIDRWCAANRHSISTASGGKITVADTGAVTTALGAVSSNSIAEARRLLAEIASGAPTSTIERYLTLIPQDIGRRAGWAATFGERSNLEAQSAFLDTLDGATAMAAAMSGDTAEADQVKFRYTLSTVEKGSKDWEDVEARFSKSINRRHTSASMRLVSLFRFGCTDREHMAAWRKEAKSFGNVRRLWHGTGEDNIISILHRGFVVPKSHGGTIRVTGRMFGDGVYFSDQSTKSLNYSAGYWGGSRHSTSSMLLADVVMGKEYRPTKVGPIPESSKLSHQSISVAGGPGCLVLNNEMIQWEMDRIRLSYLATFQA